MTEKININQGETDVKNTDETLLYSPSMIDFRETKIARKGKGEWNEFEAFGATNSSESSSRFSEEEAEVDEALMKRIQERSVGRKIRLLNLELA